ncbi:MAG: hypothetical protein ACTHOK_15795 [Nocardioidaceae bacterium]
MPVVRVGAAVAALGSLLALVLGAIGFSSVAVLVYYAIANASALTLDRDHGTKLIPVLGLVGCPVVAVSLGRSCVLASVPLAWRHDLSRVLGL